MLYALKLTNTTINDGLFQKSTKSFGGSLTDRTSFTRFTSSESALRELVKVAKEFPLWNDAGQCNISLVRVKAVCPPVTSFTISRTY